MKCKYIISWAFKCFLSFLRIIYLKMYKPLTSQVRSVQVLFIQPKIPEHNLLQGLYDLYDLYSVQHPLTFNLCFCIRKKKKTF